jgi:hypothetical protein
MIRECVQQLSEKIMLNDNLKRDDDHPDLVAL